MNEALMNVRVELGVQHLMERITDDVVLSKSSGKSWVMVPSLIHPGVVRDRIIAEVVSRVAGSTSAGSGHAIVVRW